LALAFAAGVFLGVTQAVRQHSALDSTLTVLALFFYSMPSFWLALMMILTMSLMLGWFPVSGTVSNDYEFLSLGAKILDRARHLALPTLSLALVLTAGVARFMRASMLEVVRQDYVRTAQAKGLPERVVVLKHALRNALIPVITLVGLYLPFLFSGTVFIETIFAWPGMGRLFWDAAQDTDIPVLMAILTITAVLVIVFQIVTDIAYTFLDPRIRYD
jgi:peptide/nickel transport system permease protein